MMLVAVSLPLRVAWEGLEITMALYAVRLFCNGCAQVHSIEIDLEVPSDEASIDEHELSEMVALVIETSAKCPYTGRRLNWRRNDRVCLEPVRLH